MCIWGAQLGIHLTRASWAQWMSQQTDRHRLPQSHGVGQGSRQGHKGHSEHPQPWSPWPTSFGHLPVPPPLASAPDSLTRTFPKTQAGGVHLSSSFESSIKSQWGGGVGHEGR